MQLFIQKWRIWRLQQSTFKVRRQCGFQHCCKTWMLNFTNLMSRLIPFWGGSLGTCSCHFTILSFHQPRFLPEERYNHQSRTDPSVTPWKSVPNGWEIAEAFDEVIEKARSLGLWIQFYPEWAVGVVPSCYCKECSFLSRWVDPHPFFYPSISIGHGQVIKPYSWGTHMLIVEGMKAYWTAAGLEPQQGLSGNQKGAFPQERPP